MEKYGVEEEPVDKTAEEGVRCPLCGKKCTELSPGSGLWSCPEHGTEGFEGNKEGAP